MIPRWRLGIIQRGTNKFFGTLICFFRSFISFFRTFISRFRGEFSFAPWRFPISSGEIGISEDVESLWSAIIAPYCDDLFVYLSLTTSEFTLKETIHNE